MINPKVSIVIPVYNGANFLQQAIESALNQTYENFEVIVINDGSTDNGDTDKIVKSYGNKIIYLKKENGGVASALNYGINNMSGDFFCWLSHDDVYLPDKVENQVKFHLSFNNPYDFVSYHDYFNINTDNELISRRNVEKTENEISKLLAYKFPLNFCSVFLPKKIINEVGFFDEANPIWADHKMLVDIAAHYPFKYMPGCYTKIRKHNKQETNINIRMQKYSNDSLIYGLDVYLENNPNLTIQEKISLLKNIINYTSNHGYLETSYYSLEKLKQISYPQYLFYKIITQLNFLFKKLKSLIRNILKA